MVFNPNEYDEHAYNEGHNDLIAAVTRLWYAGADDGDIYSMFESALEEIQEASGGSGGHDARLVRPAPG